MKRLIAKRHILFDGKQFKLGEELPTYNSEMVERWLECGSAEFEQPEEKSSGETTTVEETSSETKTRAKRKG